MPTAHINGIDLYYEEYGQGFPVVLVHGGGADNTQWVAQVSAFSQRYRVITYDRRGSGRSQKEGLSHSAELWVEDLHQLMRHLGIGQAYIGGTSYGGMVTLEFLLKHQDMAKAAILVSTTSEGWPGSPGFEVPFPKRGGVELGAIRVPVLIVQGENDTTFPPAIGEIIHRGIPGSEMVVIAGAGHGVNRDKPQEFNGMVLSFLARREAA